MVRIIHHTRTGENNPISYLDPNATVQDASFQLPEIGENYMLSTGNEFLFVGYSNAQATLYGERYRNSSSKPATAAKSIEREKHS